MDRELLKKANLLNDRIIKLNSMKVSLRPKSCNGIGFLRKPVGNSDQNTIQYYHNLWATDHSNKTDEVVLMDVAIKAMYDKVSELLEEAKKELKELK